MHSYVIALHQRATQTHERLKLLFGHRSLFEIPYHAQTEAEKIPVEAPGRYVRSPEIQVPTPVAGDLTEAQSVAVPDHVVLGNRIDGVTGQPFAVKALEARDILECPGAVMDDDASPAMGPQDPAQRGAARRQRGSDNDATPIHSTTSKVRHGPISAGAFDSANTRILRLWLACGSASRARLHTMPSTSKRDAYLRCRAAKARRLNASTRPANNRALDTRLSFALPQATLCFAISSRTFGTSSVGISMTV